ncbi:MAG: YebC/PmpR family DNA-binding transcriptional regulator [Clostridiales bacterium]|jgi:YebC/PmpR family DNA-binding regulatory protein|nr:YebC/PmpR family DNA-binding transcriptional regulator [Clostridiales bacterium]
MSGHSKWANIKRKKGKADAVRGKIFTKLGKELMVAVKEGGANLDGNSRLRDAVAKAKANNMPMDTITRAIKKASGDLGGASFEEIMYEGYGPAGSAVLVQCLTDNKNRTAGNVRHTFDKYGGNMGTTGCVSFMFEKKGVLAIEKQDDMDEDEIMMMALEAGAEDFSSEDDMFEIITAPEDYSSVREVLENKGLEFADADVSMIPSTYISLDNDTAGRFEKLIDILDDDEDVQNVWHNAEFPEGWGEEE